jgi:formyltetrahydrofolate deformylase
LTSGYVGLIARRAPHVEFICGGAHADGLQTCCVSRIFACHTGGVRRPSPGVTAGQTIPRSVILLIHCPDRRGIVAGVSSFLFARGANILHSEQHQDNDLGLFFMRIEWDVEGFAMEEAAFRREFEPLATSFDMRWKLAYSAARPAAAIFVSRAQHCLLDLLYRHKIGELACDIPLIVSNHEDAAGLAAFYGIPFHHIAADAGNQVAAAIAHGELLKRHAVDLIVLARYMQVLPPEFVARYAGRIINVHHSFLPAFGGARPYHAAYQRGVKLIGATSHFVTELLDDGPIIEQDVVRISHRDQVEDLVQKGRDLERVVLSRAVRWYLEHRILQYAGKTVVFD